MTTISRSDVPTYLRAGAYFQTLDPDDEGVFEVPDNCLKIDTIVESNDDLHCLLSSLRYWGVNDAPIHAFGYLLALNDPGAIDDLLLQFPEHGSYLQKVFEVVKAPALKKIPRAITAGLGLEVVKYLCLRVDVDRTEACVAAASVGDLDCLMFFHNETIASWDAREVEAAIDGGSLECLQFACENGCPLPASVMEQAARKGRIDLLKCLHDYGVPWHVDTIQHAIRSKNLECVKYLHSQGCVIGPMDCGNAAFYDSVECLAFLHSQGGTMDNMLLHIACCRSLACMEYFYTHGGVWYELCCSGAAEIDNLQCLQYAHEHGCLWDENTLIKAYKCGSWRCFWYALSHGCPCYKALSVVLDVVGCIVTTYVVNYGDNLFSACAMVYLSFQRAVKKVRQCGYFKMPSSNGWKYLFACMDWSATLGDVYFMYLVLKWLFQ